MVWINRVLNGPKPRRVGGSIQLLGGRTCDGIVWVRSEAVLEEAFLHRDLLDVLDGSLGGIDPEVIVGGQIPGGEQADL